MQGPPDRGLAHFVFFCQRGHCLACSIALGDLLALACIKGGGSTEPLALLAGLGDAGLGAGKDQ
ncbi:hypothetical protein AC630_36725 [Bradyrhizobium sp. AS23.2]|nr:hypothetical protein AC630_36725 [Bradyrhizobium sp. AS23.2]